MNTYDHNENLFSNNSDIGNNDRNNNYNSQIGTFDVSDSIIISPTPVAFSSTVRSMSCAGPYSNMNRIKLSVAVICVIYSIHRLKIDQFVIKLSVFAYI